MNRTVYSSNCPMAYGGAQQFNLSDGQIKAFCKDGCSVDCLKLFEAKYGNIKKDEDD